MRRIRFRIFLCVLLLTLANAPAAQSAGQGSGLPIPRFVSLQATEAHMRAGPGKQYPIKWTYRRPGLPLEITAEFDVWRRVRDWQGSEGWMHSSMLTGKRAMIVTGDVRALRADPNLAGRELAWIEGDVVGKVLTCPTAGEWCQVEISRVKGWMRRSEMWGVYRDEVID